jgi:hypothetical protein
VPPAFWHRHLRARSATGISEFRPKADRFLNQDFDRLPDAADHPTFRVSPIR